MASSILNTIINKLPFELHLPGYKFCGPGTKLKKRLARGDVGVNSLDNACREHDIAYHKSSNIEERHVADRKLLDVAKTRLLSGDSGVSERLASLVVASAMKGKLKLGVGIKQKRMRKQIRRKRCSSSSSSRITKKRMGSRRGNGGGRTKRYKGRA